MQDLKDKFLDFLEVRQFAPDTRRNRHDHIEAFVAWCSDRGLTRAGEITRPILERYQRHLHQYRKRNGKPLATRSQIAHLVSLRSWFRWLTRENYVAANPASELILPRKEHRLPRNVLTPGEAERVIAVPKVSDPIGLRDRAMLETLYSTGVRRAELLRLVPSDIDTERGLVLVRQGKGKKDRLIPIGARALAWIERYLVEARPRLQAGDSLDDPIFLTDRGKSIHPNHMTQIVGQYIAASEVGKTGSCHLFRHTMATAMLENGADIRFVQAMLGHAELNTTAIYTRVAVSKLKEIHDATHPAKNERPKSIE